jgi:hypothetical protein
MEGPTMRILRLAGLAGIVLAFGALGALAQEVAAPAATTVDLWPIAEQLLAVVTAVLAVAVPLVVRHYLNAWLGIRLDEKHAATLDAALRRGLTYAADKVEEKGRAATVVDVRNEMLAGAAGYALRRVPDAVRHFGLTPEALAEMARARLMLELEPVVVPVEPAGTTAQPA